MPIVSLLHETMHRDSMEMYARERSSRKAVHFQPRSLLILATRSACWARARRMSSLAHEKSSELQKEALTFFV